MAELTTIRRIGLVVRCLMLACGFCLPHQIMAQTKDYGPGSGDFIRNKKVEDRRVGKMFLLKDIVLQGREEAAPADALKPENR